MKENFIQKKKEWKSSKQEKKNHRKYAYFPFVCSSKLKLFFITEYLWSEMKNILFPFISNNK